MSCPACTLPLIGDECPGCHRLACRNPYTDEIEGWMVPFNPWDKP